MANFTAWDYALISLNSSYILFGSLTMLLNGFCLTAMVRGRILSKNSAFLLVAALSVSDGVEGVAFIITGVLRLQAIADSTVRYVQLHCYLVNFPMYFSVSLTGFTMMIVALERLYLVAFPLSYRLHGDQVVKVAVLLDVLASVVAAILGAIDVSDTKVLTSCNTSSGVSPAYYVAWTGVTRIFTLATNCLAYALVVILYTKRRKARTGAAPNDPQAKSMERQKRELMVLALTICAVYIIFSGTGVTFTSFIAPQMPTALVSATMVQIGGLLTLSNALVNVFIFPLKNADLRKAMKDTLCCGKATAGGSRSTENTL